MTPKEVAKASGVMPSADFARGYTRYLTIIYLANADCGSPKQSAICSAAVGVKRAGG